MEPVERSPSSTGLSPGRVRALSCGFAAGLVAALVILPAAKATPNTHQAAALELLELMQSESLMNSGIQQMLDMQVKQNPALEPARPVMLAFFRKYMSWSSLKGDFAQIYVKAFTEKELRELAAFYGTPTGSKAISLMPKLMERGMLLANSRVQEHLPELQKMLTEKSEPAAKGSSGAAKSGAR